MLLLSGCGLFDPHRGQQTGVAHAPPPLVADDDSAGFIYVNPVASEAAPPQVCKVVTVTYEIPRQEVSPQPVPGWHTRTLTQTHHRDAVARADHVHIRSLTMYSEGGDSLLWFLGWVTIWSQDRPLAWTPPQLKEEPIEFEVDGSIDLVPLLDSDGAIELDSEFRAKSPEEKTAIAARVEVDIWSDCSTN